MLHQMNETLGSIGADFLTARVVLFDDFIQVGAGSKEIMSDSCAVLLSWATLQTFRP